MCLDQYKTGLNERLTTIEQDNNNSTVSDSWTNVQQVIKESAKTSAGVKLIRVTNKNAPRMIMILFLSYRTDKKTLGYKFKTPITKKER